MDKNEVLTKLRSAKSSHVNWVQKAKMLIEGIDIDKSSIPVNATECKFGLWFYSDAQKLNALRNISLDSMASIETLHMQLHDKYLMIYKVYYSGESGGFFKKFFGKKQEIPADDLDQAKIYFQELQDISKVLIEEINRMERRIIALGDEEIENL